MDTKTITLVVLTAVLLAKECKLKSKDKQLKECREQQKRDCCVYKRYINNCK